MGYMSAEEVFAALVDAYYDKRDIEATLSCVTDDVQWIGTEESDNVSGKEELRKLLEADVNAFPKSFGISFSAPVMQKLCDDAVIFTVNGKQEEVPNVLCSLSVRGTACCVRTEKGWLFSNIHTSVPNSEMEKVTLEKVLDEKKRREQTVMASIPGGVAIYRQKKDGRVETEFVSESLAAMCGYTADEFLALLKNNSLVNLVPEDIEPATKAVAHCIEDGLPINARYRIYNKNKEEILIRLDANIITSEPLQDDDVCVLYAVHTLVSDDAKHIMQNEKHLQQLVDLVPVGIGIYDIIDGEAILTYLNDAYYKMMGFQRHERADSYGKNHISVIHPDDKKAVFDMISALVKGSDTGLVQHRIKNKKGEWIWLNLAASVVERKGNKLKVYVAFTNCNEVMKSKLEIADAQFRLQALIDNIPGGVAIYRVKKDGSIPIDFVSDGLARVCGYDDSADFMKVMNPDSRKLVFEEDYSRVGIACKNSIATGEPTHVNYRIHSKNGELVWISLDSVIMKNAQLGEDDVAVFYAVQAPVSENALRAQTEQDYYRSILNITQTAFFELDEKGSFYSSDTFANYKLSEYGAEVIYGGVNASRCIHPDDYEKVREYLMRVSKAKDGTSVIVRMMMKNGSYQWTEITGHVEFDENHRLKRMTGILRDMNTEWQQQKADLEAALEEAKKASNAKTAFLSRVSHDMRTPLNGILGLTHILKDNIEDSDNLHDLDQLEMSGRYLLNLINDTLDMSRIESGKLELHPVVCDGLTFFNTAMGLAKTSIEAKGLHYEIHTDKRPFTVLYTDVDRAEQVIMNVISNAVKFTPFGGQIDINMKNIGSENGVITEQITIADTGIGMSPEFLPHIFDAFAQEDASSTSTFQGTGLGMAITKQLLQQMGGDISVTSQLGKGSCFTIIMKFQKATKEQIDEWKKAQLCTNADADLSGKRILLCEDHPLNAQIATRLLEAKGIAVERAVNGQIGVDMFSASALGYYDVILMDIRMPVMDGITAAKAIRKLSRRDAETIPIIAMTANAFNDDIEKTQKAGMNAHLSKPIQPSVMYETIAKAISKEQ